MTKLFGLLLLAGTAAAQNEMSLRDAVRLALENNQAVAASGAAEGAAQSRIREARAGFLPKVNYSESWTRSNNPVYVFSSLLTQHQFAEQNFQIGPLNRPESLNNFQSLVTIDQTVYDAGQSRHAVRSAELTKNIAGESRRLTEMETVAAVVRAYYDSVLSVEELNAAIQAVRSAEADLRRAEAVRTAGLSTDVDVLSIRVHLASVEEQRIRRSADVDVSRAALNDALGFPLDTQHKLTTPLSRAAVTLSSLEEYESSGAQGRPEVQQAKRAKELAETHIADTRSSLLPQIVVHGAFETDRQNFYERGGGNWLGSVSLHWNVFNGFSDKARIEEGKSLLKRSEADEQRTNSAVRLQIRRAWADLRAAEQRIEAAEATVAEAEESLRITQNRYEGGLSNVTDLLRTETAVLDSRTRYLAALHDQRIAATMLEFAAGRLNPNSEVLN
jgi:outer membrane protein TolC